jgi:hypothetical protein
MMRRFAVLLALVLLPSCRDYDYADRVSGSGGLMQGDQFARYGREQAQAVAIARQFASAHEGPSLEERGRQVEAAAAFARNQPDVAEVVADSQGYWLTLRFRSGWRTAVTPLADGKSAADTPNLPAPARSPSAQ